MAATIIISRELASIFFAGLPGVILDAIVIRSDTARMLACSFSAAARPFIAESRIRNVLSLNCSSPALSAR